MRYDRAVRSLLALVIVACAASAVESKPRLRDIDFFDGTEAVEPCGRGKTWPVVQKCLGKTGKIDVMYQTDRVKLITVTTLGRSPTIRALLYTRADTDWTRGNLSAFFTSGKDSLRVEPFTTPVGEGVRIDIGKTSRTMISLDSLASQRGIIRTTFAHVCLPPSYSCRSLMIHCEAYVRGKVYWSWRGEPVWHASLGLRIRGSRTATGGVCSPPPSMIIDGDG